MSQQPNIKIPVDLTNPGPVLRLLRVAGIGRPPLAGGG